VTAVPCAARRASAPVRIPTLGSARAASATKTASPLAATVPPASPQAIAPDPLPDPTVTAQTAAKAAAGTGTSQTWPPACTHSTTVTATSRQYRTGHPRDIRPVDDGNDGSERGQQPRQAGGCEQPDLEEGGGTWLQLLPVGVPRLAQTDLMIEIHYAQLFPLAKVAIVGFGTRLVSELQPFPFSQVTVIHDAPPERHRPAVPKVGAGTGRPPGAAGLASPGPPASLAPISGLVASCDVPRRGDNDVGESAHRRR
jgi:hypothetical protein